MDESLKHVGVLGMRWGVRNGPSSNQSSDHASVSNIRKKKVSELSNQEIRQLLERSLLEKQYRDLHPSIIAKGGKLVGNMILKTGTVEAQKYIDRELPKYAAKALLLLKTMRP